MDLGTRTAGVSLSVSILEFKFPPVFRFCKNALFLFSPKNGSKLISNNPFLAFHCSFPLAAARMGVVGTQQGSNPAFAGFRV